MAMQKAGSLAARAKKNGQTTAAFAEANKGAAGTVGKLARMYFVAQAPGMSGKASMEEPGDNRPKRNPLYQVG